VAALIRDVGGVTPLEYGVMAALIAILITCNLYLLGVHLRAAFNLVSGGL
jgi:Flp pilus assembly pilin Flp